ncbi:MAG: diphthamide synthesis protein [Nitrososphaerota archaeon]|nr:diphthamide synthesis protein [Nitrososphaerota archaeon]MDG6930255.1 diphthamide synthesis protein [Nitrososphaerota archaeon]MDG6932621.1 diphthamide synthesis protein [Nitrososphaerota archaeon]MDG6935587.1 diphthamide synthesis protein [Nitrososphaerota archaeon]MDG6944031.1 diphthamide synthesis protein [Nitrososphaerota archaeon]
MLKLDRQKIKDVIERERPRRVGLAAPDGLLNVLPELASYIESFGVESVIFGEPSYGTCDLNVADSQLLNLDVVFNIGHATAVENIGKVYLIDAQYEFETHGLASELHRYLKNSGASKPALFTTSNYRDATQSLKKELDSLGMKVVEPGNFPGLFEGQVFGCNYYSSALARDADILVFVGQSPFHAAGLALTSEKRTVMADPHNGTVEDVSKTAETLYRAAVARIMLARNADKIGVIVGLKEGQMFYKKARWMSGRLVSMGKESAVLAMREITPPKLNAIRGFDAFVEMACPRIPMADRGFDRPVLSYPEGLGLLRILDKKELGNPYKISVLY